MWNRWNGVLPSLPSSRDGNHVLLGLRTQAWLDRHEWFRLPRNEVSRSTSRKQHLPYRGEGENDCVFEETLHSVLFLFLSFLCASICNSDSTSTSLLLLQTLPNHLHRRLVIIRIHNQGARTIVLLPLRLLLQSYKLHIHVRSKHAIKDLLALVHLLHQLHEVAIEGLRGLGGHYK